jgi:hypothetical protein
MFRTLPLHQLRAERENVRLEMPVAPLTDETGQTKTAMPFQPSPFEGESDRKESVMNAPNWGKKDRFES